MCNCGGGAGIRALAEPGGSRAPVLPTGGQMQVWFHMPSLGPSDFYVTYGPVTGRALYFVHNGFRNMDAADALWMIQNPKWLRGKPDDAILARRGEEYVLYQPSESGVVSGAIEYVFSVGVEQPVLNVDLSAVQAAVSGTIL